jgi:hypothetical protein
MKRTFSLVGTILATCLLSAEPEIDPFTPPKPGEEVPPGADIDPFAPPRDGAEADDVHRWEDQVVEPGGPKGPDFVSIGGWFDGRLDRFGVVFRIALKPYEEATGHPDLNRGVALLSGELANPDLCTWLRPVQIAGDRATFIVIGSRKQLNGMHISFIPREGKRRHLYSLGRTVQDIMERDHKDRNNQNSFKFEVRQQVIDSISRSES